MKTKLKIYEYKLTSAVKGLCICKSQKSNMKKSMYLSKY